MLGGKIESIDQRVEFCNVAWRVKRRRILGARFTLRLLGGPFRLVGGYNNYMRSVVPTRMNSEYHLRGLHG